MLFILLSACHPDVEKTIVDSTSVQDSSNDTTAPDTAVPDTGANDPEPDDTYAFVRNGNSTVSYSGQTFRLALISELQVWMTTRQDAIVAGTYAPGSEETILNDISFFLEFDSSIGGSLPISFIELSLQETFDDISSGKNILEKLAGNDPATDYTSWNTGAFKGWQDNCSMTPGIHPCTPTGLVQVLSQEFAERILSEMNGPSIGPTGEYRNSAVTPSGRHIPELLNAFLTLGVSYAQAMDDYLDTGTENKGLHSDHSTLVDGQHYTALEHAWDEGFGYFGIAQDFSHYDDNLIETGYFIDGNADGLIDLKSEYIWPTTQRFAQNDLPIENNRIQDLFVLFHTGRLLIHSQDLGPLSSETQSELEAIRDEISRLWFNAIAQDVIIGLEHCIEHTNTFNTSSYDFEQHAQDWSRLKGLALGLQFDSRSPLSSNDFEHVHLLIGDAPVLPTATEAELETALDKLEEAQSILNAQISLDK